MLTNLELDRMREDALASLPDLCDILRPTRLSDGRGGTTQAWQPFAYDIPCRLGPATGEGSEGVLGARLTAESDWVLTLAYDQVIDTKDRIRLGSNQYEVVGIKGGRSFQVFVRVGLTDADYAPVVKERTQGLRENWITFDAAKWDETNVTPTLANESVGVPFGGGEAYVGAKAKGQGYRLEDSYLYVDVQSVGDGPSNRNVELLAYKDANNQCAIQYENGELFIKFRDQGVNTDSAGIPYDPVAHRWWRINAFPGGTMSFTVSPDGQLWEDPWQESKLATGNWPLSVTVYLNTVAVDGTAGEARFGHVNLP